MKVALSVIFALGFGVLGFSQIQGPRLSPQGKVEQKIGLTDIKVEYYRPSKSGRVVFGDVVPLNETWRTGANENTKFTCSDAIVFGTDTLKAGTYALYTKPTEKAWEVYFYNDYSNWGLPENWDDAKVVLKLSAAVMMSSDVVETFTIGIDNITTSTANLIFSWDKTRVSVPFAVPTKSKMQASIDKTLAGPTANDYYAAADYYYNAKLDMKQALAWMDKYISMKGEETPFYVYRKKALIQAELKDFKGAIETAKISSASAEKAGNTDYVEMNKKSIEEWSKKK